MAQVKYFKSYVGKLVTNGALKIKFVTEILPISNEIQADLLKKATDVVEVSEKEAEAAGVDVGVQEAGEGEEVTLTVAQLKEKALLLGATEDELKAVKNKKDLVKFVADKEAEIAKTEKDASAAKDEKAE